MSTWVVHLRIADYFLNKLDVSATEFVIGSVAPDCGYGEKDSMGEFTPPPAVTHWSPSGRKRDCRYMDFYDEYLKDKDTCEMDYSFYLGYYVHLLTDIMWSERIYIPTMKKHADGIRSETEVLKSAKKDWNDLDFEFLYNNPDYQTYKILCNVTEVKDYLPYYEPDQLSVQVKFIADYYKSKRDFNRPHIYLSRQDVDNFIKKACQIIESEISSKKLAQFKK